MRFSYCESLIEKKFFFIFSVEYTYTTELNNFLLRQYGLSKFFKFFSYMLFELHNSNLNISKPINFFGILRSKNFAKLLLYFFQPHINIKNYFFFNILRLFKPLTLRGLNLVRGLPTRGQRTHSNKKNIIKFKNFFSNYILTIPRPNFYNYVSSIKLASIKEKDVTLKIKKKKTKVKVKNLKNKKKKKQDV
jgi:hypothetical protein